MFIERVHSPGLAHISYFVGGREKAAVVDPRRDVEIYLDLAREHGLRITHIFETHRNEDYVIGSRELTETTGAEVYHGAELPFEYGVAVSEGDSFELDGLRLGVLSTPGHTPESICVTLADLSASEEPVGVFTGDVLFVGDVGRTDFIEGGAELLYGSLFEKLLPLGDHLIIYPAHGAGSVCGAHLSAREFSTLGHERRHNLALQHADRQAFIHHKNAEQHYRPPYFRRMEQQNLAGPDFLAGLPDPDACSADEFAARMQQGMLIIDTRTPEGFGGAHIPGSFALPLGNLPAFAGWLLSYDTPLGLVVERPEDVETAVRYLVRIGYDDVDAYLSEGMHDWETGGRQFEGLPQVYIGEIKRRLEAKEEFILLDVRSQAEFEAMHLEGSRHIYVGELPDRLAELPKDKLIATFCGSGHRAIIAASILKRNGFERVENCLGSMAACRATGCPLVTTISDGA
jgi:hydroxyacylglutathione hydrolase